MFIKIVSVNNVLFNYCGTCYINDDVICCFVKCQQTLVVSLENCDTIYINTIYSKWNMQIPQTIKTKTYVNKCL